MKHQHYSIRNIFFDKMIFYNCNVFMKCCMCEYLFTLHLILLIQLCSHFLIYFYIRSKHNLNDMFCCLQNISSTFWDKTFFCMCIQNAFSFLKLSLVKEFIILMLKNHHQINFMGSLVGGLRSLLKRSLYFFMW